jgi:membrane protease YdiL (CAAX protease family)
MQDEALLAQEEDPAWGLVATLLWGCLIAFAFIIAQSLAFGIYIGLQQPEWLDADVEALTELALTNGSVIAYSTLLSTPVCVALILIITWLKRGARIGRYLAWRGATRRELLRWLLIIALFLLLSDLAIILLDLPVVPEIMFAQYHSAQPKWMFWLAIVLAAPLAEELFFRGFLYKGLARSPLRPAGAILLTAAVWAVIHQQYDLYGVLLIFLSGLILGVARERTGSVQLPLLLHGVSNFVAMVQVALGV